MEMTDISERKDIDLIVDIFYHRLLNDEEMRPLFSKVLEQGLDHHLPIIGDFWESILLGNIVYKGNAMEKHLQLHQKTPLLPKHFIRWIDHWQNTIDANFEGPVAKEAKRRAGMIAQLMQYKVQQLENGRFK